MKRAQKPLQKTRDLGHQQKRIIEGVVFVIQTIRLSVPGTVSKRFIEKFQTRDMTAVIIFIQYFWRNVLTRKSNGSFIIIMLLPVGIMKLWNYRILNINMRVSKKCSQVDQRVTFVVQGWVCKTFFRYFTMIIF